MSSLAPIIGAIVKAILEALLGKPVKQEKSYEDVGEDTDNPFSDSDW